MTHGSLFSGIGGFDLAAHWAGIENIFACEIDEFCTKVLTKRFPNTILYNDIKETSFEQYRGTVDIISGGFPCQPFSIAGKRAGTEDNRYLWGEMLRVVREVTPTWVIAENVRGLLTIENGNTFETVCDDLEISGYEVQSFIIPALSTGAPHKRDRLWIVANRTTIGRDAVRHESRNISEEVQETPEREFSRAIGIFNRNITNTNSNVTEYQPGEVPGETTGDEGATRIENGQRMWREFGTGISESPNFAPDSGSDRYRGGGIGNDSDLRERIICENEQDDRNPLRSEIKSGNEFDFADTTGERSEGSLWGEPNNRTVHNRGKNWSEKWSQALARIYGMDDGLPGGVDRLEQRYKSRSRRERIKTMGNSIVPQIAYQIFLSILEAERKHDNS